MPLLHPKRPLIYAAFPLPSFFVPRTVWHWHLPADRLNAYFLVISILLCPENSCNVETSVPHLICRSRRDQANHRLGNREPAIVNREKKSPGELLYYSIFDSRLPVHDSRFRSAKPGYFIKYDFSPTAANRASRTINQKFPGLLLTD